MLYYYYYYYYINNNNNNNNNNRHIAHNDLLIESNIREGYIEIDAEARKNINNIISPNIISIESDSHIINNNKVTETNIKKNYIIPDFMKDALASHILYTSFFWWN